jgi:hypothetical protein
VVLLTDVARSQSLAWMKKESLAANTELGTSIHLPIVIGNANDTKKPGQLAGALERTNNFLVPIISSDTVVRLLDRSS